MTFLKQYCKQLNYFKNRLGLTIWLVALFCAISTSAQTSQKNFLDINYIQVSGTVESNITPDKIYVSITINEKDKKGKISVEMQEAKMIQKLNSIGIDLNKNLSVQSFHSSYNSYILKKDDVLKVKKYLLLVHNTEHLSKVFKIFDQLEISNVYISKVDHSKMEELKLEAKIKAIQTAKKKATTYAKAIDQSIGKALLITEKNNQHFNNSNAIYGARATNVLIREYGALNTKNKIDGERINFKDITITASIEATFELK